MIVCWISSVPPAIEMPGTDTRISAITPSAGASGLASRPDAPAIDPCTRAACRAISLLASLPIDPAAPGFRPAAIALARRCAVHRADIVASASRAICCLITGSVSSPASTARGATRSGRPARCGYHLCGSRAAVRSSIASRQARPTASGDVAGREAASLRSCASVVIATVQPPPGSPIRFSAGISASSKNTSLND